MKICTLYVLVTAPEYNHIIFRAISQIISTTATDNTQAGAWRHPPLHKGAQVDKRATHIMHHNVIGGFQQGL